MKIISETQGMLNDNWEETQKSNLFVLIESDAGGNATWINGGTVTYTDPSTGNNYTLSTTYSIESEDTIMLQRIFNRNYIFSLNDDFLHSIDSGNIEWYSPIFEY